MTMHPDSHLESRRLQALAEGELAGDEERAVRAHLAECARCRAEAEGWTLLFEELGGLPDLGPSPHFAERVMAEMKVEAPARVPLLGRLRALLPFTAKSPELQHLSGPGIQNYLEGLLDRGVETRVAAHLRECEPCRGQLSRWETVFESLQSLSRFEPSPAFADRVMRRVPVRAIAVAARSPEPGWTDRIAAAARRRLPSTRRGWAVTGGVVAAPAVGLTLAVAAVVLHPLVSLGDVRAWAVWRMAETAGLLWNWSLGVMTESTLVYWAMGTLVSIGQTPAIVMAALAAVSTATIAAGWILFRYVIAPSLSTGHHVRAS